MLINLLNTGFAEIQENFKSANKEKFAQLKNLQYPASLIGLAKTPYIYVSPTVKPFYSMQQMLSSTRPVNGPECRFFMKDILEGIAFLHDLDIVHGHLSLCNLHINEEMHVVIYAGVSDLMDHFPPPEVFRGIRQLCMKADVWAIGCIMYKLLMGVGPFDTPNTDTTIMSTAHASIRIPPHVPIELAEMMASILKQERDDRPTAKSLLTCKFMTMSPIPDEFSVLARSGPEFNFQCLRQLYADGNNSDGVLHNVWPWLTAMQGEAGVELIDLHKQLQVFMRQMLTVPHHLDPPLDIDVSAQPRFWVVQYFYNSSGKNLYYSFADGSHGAIFEDGSQIVVHKCFYNVKYIDKHGHESATNMDSLNESMAAKIKLIVKFGFFDNPKYIPSYVVPLKNAVMLKMPHVQTWLHNGQYMVLHLSNGIIQFMGYNSTAFIFSPYMKSITHFVENSTFPHTFKYETLMQTGFMFNIPEPLQTTLAFLERMVNVVNTYRVANPDMDSASAVEPWYSVYRSAQNNH